MAGNAIIDNIDEHIRVIELVRNGLLAEIEAVGRVISKSLQQGGTVFWCGNGGSAADSQHLAAELVGRFKKDRPPLRSSALTTDTSILTCVANDYNYNDIFARQIGALGRAGDVLVAISTSGNSMNVIRALDMAKNVGMATVALLGKDGGRCKDMAEQVLLVHSQDTARIQEAHILIGHILCDLIEREMGYA